MGFFAKLFGAVPRRELSGICLGEDAHWEVSPAGSFPDLLRALPKLIPQDAILYIEGGRPPKDIKAYLDERCVPEVAHLQMGTIWPRPHVHHLPATSQNLDRLAELAAEHHIQEIACHIHVYRQNRVLLQWYDAFSGDPMYISEDIPEEALKQFCSELSLTYKRYREGA